MHPLELSAQARAIADLTKAGYEPGSVVLAVLEGGDWMRLRHRGILPAREQAPQLDGVVRDPGFSLVRA